MKLTPVILPPGRLRLATMPASTGSVPAEKTIGMVGVAAFAARAVAVPNALTNDRHLTPREIGSQFRKATIVAVCPTEFDRDIAAIGISGFTEALSECGQSTGVRLGRARMEKSD
ncbi:MAG: hypothetical protein WAZ97_03390 [Pseudolabrys sp.]